MAFSDPQSISVATVAKTLPRISTGVNSSVYTSPDGAIKFTISHQYGKTRTRRSVRIDFAKISADPLITNVNTKYGMSTYFVTDIPLTGFSVKEQTDNLLALAKWLEDLAAANAAKYLGGEN